MYRTDSTVKQRNLRTQIIRSNVKRSLSFADCLHKCEFRQNEGGLHARNARHLQPFLCSVWNHARGLRGTGRVQGDATHCLIASNWCVGYFLRYLMGKCAVVFRFHTNSGMLLEVTSGNTHSLTLVIKLFFQMEFCRSYAICYYNFRKCWPGKAVFLNTTALHLHRVVKFWNLPKGTITPRRGRRLLRNCRCSFLASKLTGS